MTDLMLTHVNMIHVDQGYNIAVLVIIQGDPDFVEKQLYIELWRLAVEFVIHDDLKTRQ